MLQLPALLSLAAHDPADATEAAFRKQMIAFIEANHDFAARINVHGHVTASGWIVDASGTKALLIHHAKLNRWLQPGGHVEQGDPTLAAAALREVIEETGLQDVQLVSEAPFDLDIHSIPARGTEPEHLHYDCRFLFRAGADASVTISTELHGFKWVSTSALTGPDVMESLRRMARKSV